MKIAIQTNVWNTAYHQNLPGLLSEVRIAGYDGLEIGAHRLDLSHPEPFADMLTRNGLAVSALHIHGELHNPAAMEPLYDFYAQAAGFAATVAAPFVLLSGKPKDGGKSEKELADEVLALQHISKICGEQGLQLCYHNHYWEIQEGMRELQYLVAHSSAQTFGLALDVAWVHRAGYHPADIIHRFQDRIRYLHLKDTISDRFTDLGQGEVDFAAVKQAIQGMPLPWLAVERDEVLPEALASARACRDYLRSLFS